MSRMSLAAAGNSRMSILPGSSQRSAKPGGLVGLSDTMAGLSVGSSNRNSDIRRSSAINTATGRPSMGRQSMGFGGRPSLSAASSLSGQVSSNSKDPRPLRDKPWQTKAIKQLVSFLAQTGCPVAVSAKKLTSPSSKDFSDIFKFLYRMLEPNHEFKSKIEEELLPLLRTLRYPFAEQINKSQLFSIGSPHAWPTFLGILHWLMEEIMCCNQFDEQSEIENDGMGGGSIGDSRQPEKIFHDYVIRTYIAFLEGSDDFDAIDRELMNSFDRKNEATIRDVERMRREHHALEEELASLTQGESPLDSLIRENSILGSDKEKFQTYIAHVEVKEQKLQEGLLSAKQELDIQEDELAQVTAEKIELQQIVDAQEISPADVDRMNAERDQLAFSLQTVSTKLESANKAVWEKEIALQKRMDQLEKVVQDYNSHAFKLGLVGSHSAELAHVSKELELHIQADTQSRMVSVDLKGVVKPILENLKDRYNGALHKAQDDMLGLQETLDQLVWTQTRDEEELLTVQSRIAFLNQRYNEEKEHVTMTTISMNEEIEQFERQIQKMKIDSNGIMIASQQKAQKATIEYEELSRMYTEQKEKVLNTLVRGLQDVFGMQTSIAAAIEELTQQANESLIETTNTDWNTTSNPGNSVGISS
ncbi:hypothetical protein BASA50_004094 [Batrachochytrium salamandrivorans]|uniref:Kinetochore protein NDC80 n=1 Tax=Batrachochytrium salamandrivorans TaxID=1357716 RepID=A0ABQ8FH11_9FUNG|nr:hypothetical protein BASA60_010183 [Batrachochytrium salamandrivorans]KAH6576754.1 hypothetical protein BASA62_001205 [Batrachochytrium salamandrivorans]KAH6582664.1 hypothetical protein BASA61_008414 [Batrachochytrium salamandrivorans]KAH6597939.1 hypothetical protein BASA50_004094 [Batrachochytrium salamandrivorans]KAH9257216.1 hypothetical protein BASA81_004605 [Batrachochytrium salamandrivorans]